MLNAPTRVLTPIHALFWGTHTKFTRAPSTLRLRILWSLLTRYSRADGIPDMCLHCLGLVNYTYRAYMRTRLWKPRCTRSTVEISLGTILPLVLAGYWDLPGRAEIEEELYLHAMDAITRGFNLRLSQMITLDGRSLLTNSSSRVLETSSPHRLMVDCAASILHPNRFAVC
jgi:hypothetical protein